MIGEYSGIEDWSARAAAGIFVGAVPQGVTGQTIPELAKRRPADGKVVRGRLADARRAILRDFVLGSDLVVVTHNFGGFAVREQELILLRGEGHQLFREIVETPFDASAQPLCAWISTVMGCGPL